MNEIGFLPSDGRIFDHEDLAREVLRHALKNWLDQKSFDLHAVRAMRAIVRELIDLPEETYFEACAQTPKLLDPLARSPFSSLEEVNRRECIRLCLEYAGITERNGVDVLGARGWNDLQTRTDELCAFDEEPSVETLPQPDLMLAEEAARSSAVSPSAWPQDVIADLLIRLLNGKTFSHYEFDRVLKAVGHYRAAVKADVLPEADAFLYAGMCSLDYVRFYDMAEEVRSGLPGAILRALHLNDDSSPGVIGNDAWRKVSSFYCKWAARPWKSPPDATDGGSRNAWRSVIRVGLVTGALVTAAVIAVVFKQGGSRDPAHALISVDAYPPLQVQGDSQWQHRSAASASPAGKDGLP